MARKSAPDDLLAPLTLAVGQEELLLDRAVAQVVAAARAADPDTDVRDLAPGALQPGSLAELTTPSLFAERKVIVVRAAQDLAADSVKELKAYLAAPADEVIVVLVHAGGARARACWTRRARRGPRGAVRQADQGGERVAFVRGEFKALGRSASPEACQALLDALGGDLRELAAAASQLTSDVEGPIDERVVARYYSGRAEATGFEVADLAVTGRAADALERLRWALAVGQPPTGITYALASGCAASAGWPPRTARCARATWPASSACRRGRWTGSASRCAAGRATGWPSR